MLHCFPFMGLAFFSFSMPHWLCKLLHIQE